MPIDTAFAERRYQQVSEVKTAVETIVQVPATATRPSDLGIEGKIPSRAKRQFLIGASVGMLLLSVIGCLHYRVAHFRESGDLLQRYPSQLTAGDLADEHARSWRFTEADLCCDARRFPRCRKAIPRRVPVRRVLPATSEEPIRYTSLKESVSIVMKRRHADEL